MIAAAGHSDWIKSGYKFPCPMINHDHEIV